jgi:hypothetical protein
MKLQGSGITKHYYTQFCMQVNGRLHAEAALTFQNPVITIPTTFRNIKKLTSSTQCIYMYRTILTTNCYCFSMPH